MKGGTGSRRGGQGGCGAEVFAGGRGAGGCLFSASGQSGHCDEPWAKIMSGVPSIIFKSHLHGPKRSRKKAFPPPPAPAPGPSENPFAAGLTPPHKKMQKKLVFRIFLFENENIPNVPAYSLPSSQSPSSAPSAPIFSIFMVRRRILAFSEASNM